MSLVDRLQEAANNVEAARTRGQVECLAGWEHAILREAAAALTPRPVKSTEITDAHTSESTTAQVPGRWYRGPFDEMGTAECRPAVHIHDGTGKRVLIVDADDFGYRAYGTGSDIVAHQERVRDEVIKIADLIVRSVNARLVAEPEAQDAPPQRVGRPRAP